MTLSHFPEARVRARASYHHIWPIESVFDGAIDLSLSGCTNLRTLRLDSVVVQKYTSVIVWTRSGIYKCLKAGKLLVKVNVQNQWNAKLTLHAIRRNFSLLGTRPACSSLSRISSVVSSMIVGPIANEGLESNTPPSLKFMVQSALSNC